MAIQLKTPAGSYPSKPCMYRGRRFPSRIEARWAAFLDSLEIRYENPAPGVYGTYGWLNPDFALHGYDIVLEIKGADIPRRDPDSSEIIRVASLRGVEYAKHTHKLFAIVGGFTRHDYGASPEYSIRVYDPSKNVWYHPAWWDWTKDGKLTLTSTPKFNPRITQALFAGATHEIVVLESPVGQQDQKAISIPTTP